MAPEWITIRALTWIAIRALLTRLFEEVIPVAGDRAVSTQPAFVNRRPDAFARHFRMICARYHCYSQRRQGREGACAAASCQRRCTRRDIILRSPAACTANHELSGSSSAPTRASRRVGRRNQPARRDTLAARMSKAQHCIQRHAESRQGRVRANAGANPRMPPGSIMSAAQSFFRSASSEDSPCFALFSLCLRPMDVNWLVRVDAGCRDTMPRRRRPGNLPAALNEGRGLNPGDTVVADVTGRDTYDRSTKAGASTPATLVGTGRRSRSCRTLNEGRGLNPAQSLSIQARGLNEGRRLTPATPYRRAGPRRPGYAQRRPGPQPRRHPSVTIGGRSHGSRTLNEGRGLNPGDT